VEKILATPMALLLRQKAPISTKSVHHRRYCY